MHLRIIPFVTFNVWSLQNLGWIMNLVGQLRPDIILQIVMTIILPYFPVDNAHLMYNAHPVFSVLTNIFNRYRATWKYMESYDWLQPGPYLGILCPWAQENVPPPPYLFVFSSYV
jgi:hypothetical protein